MQEEAIGDESQGLVSMLLKQVRPGMDLSRVVLPTFILEPRSFLEKLGDFFAHVRFSLLFSLPFLFCLSWDLCGACLWLVGEGEWPWHTVTNRV